jgi:hypothetical protein
MRHHWHDVTDASDPEKRALNRAAATWAHVRAAAFASRDIDSDSTQSLLHFWGPIPWHRGTFLVRFIRTHPSVVRVVTSGVVSVNLFLAGFDPVTSSFKNR